MGALLSTGPAALALGLALALGPGRAPAAGESRAEGVELVNLNLLHGYACDPPSPADGDQCRLGSRLDLLMQHIAAAGCPDLVTLQENVTAESVKTGLTRSAGPLDDSVRWIEERLPDLAARCGFPYQVVFDPAARRPPPRGRGQDEPLILTRYPALASGVRILYGPLAPFFVNLVLYARIDHPAGPLDVFTTHLASGGDYGDARCGVDVVPLLFRSTCPEECDADADTVRECQARQTALFVEARHAGPGPALLSGDFNAGPGSRVYREFAGRGWIDSFLAAGNPECEPKTGSHCTSGRADDSLSQLESRELNQSRRIDFVFVAPARPGSGCAGEIARVGAGGSPVRTGLFAGTPNPFAPACGAAPLPICWPSDHSGNALELRCQPSAAASASRSP